MKRGKFIVFEGLDGSGQSTQVGRLASVLKKNKIKVHTTKEPTNNLIGGLIRGQLRGDWKSSPECLQLLFAADRAHHLEKEIEPYLKKGITVISDRYFFSTMAFGSLEISDRQWLKDINRRFPLPDIAFYLQVSPRNCIKRIKEDRFSFELFEKEKKLEEIEKDYKKIAKEYKSFEVIDGERQVEEITEEIKNKALTKFFK